MRRSLLRLGAAALFVILLLGVVRPLVAEPFLISSDSMVPTLRAGQQVIVLKAGYDASSLHRGDVVAITGIRHDDEVSIKRVVGVAGDTIAVRDGHLVVNGHRWIEPYVDYPRVDGFFMSREIVPSGHVFVMGDNRSQSRDSHNEKVGPLPERNLVGKVVLRLWPPWKAGGL